MKKIYEEAEEKLYKKGYYVSNMVYDNTMYEICDGNGKVLIDYLSLSHLECLANMLPSIRK